MKRLHHENRPKGLTMTTFRFAVVIAVFIITAAALPAVSVGTQPVCLQMATGDGDTANRAEAYELGTLIGTITNRVLLGGRAKVSYSTDKHARDEIEVLMSRAQRCSDDVGAKLAVEKSSIHWTTLPFGAMVVLTKIAGDQANKNLDPYLNAAYWLGFKISTLRQLAYTGSLGDKLSAKNAQLAYTDWSKSFADLFATLRLSIAAGSHATTPSAILRENSDLDAAIRTAWRITSKT